MNIKRAKEEIRNTIEAYLLKNEYGEYEIPVMAQRPVFLIGAPGIGKTQIMEQISKCIEEKCDALKPEKYDSPLTETYLLGYYLQKNALYTKKQDDTEVENDDAQE